MIIVDYNDIGIKRGLWQYDFGQVLRIQGGNLKSAVEIHFSLQETGGEAVTRIGKIGRASCRERVYSWV